jgi:hypothetical protein
MAGKVVTGEARPRECEGATGPRSRWLNAGRPFASSRFARADADWPAGCAAPVFIRGSVLASTADLTPALVNTA